MSMTFAEAHGATRFAIEDANLGRTWSNKQLRTAVNFALQDLWSEMVKCNKSWFETHVGFGLTANIEEYVLPSMANRIISVEYLPNNGSPRKLPRLWIEDRRYYSLGNVSTLHGTPSSYYVRGGNIIGILPMPTTDDPYRSTDGGPIRINYVEKVPSCETLDPIYGLTEVAYDPANSIENMFGVIGQGLNGPLVKASFDQISGGGTWPNRNKFFEVVSFFVDRDRDSNPLAPSQHRSPPHIGTFAIFLDAPSITEPILNVTGIPEENDWPKNATHLDIWVRETNSSTEANGTISHMHWLTTIKKAESDDVAQISFKYYDDGTTTFLKATKRPVQGDVTPALMYGTQIPGTYTNPTFGWKGAVGNRILNMFPKSAYDRSSYWAPFGSRSGTAINTDTRRALGDADLVHIEFGEEYREMLAVQAALTLNMRHGIENRVLALRKAELLPVFREMVASRDMTPRKVQINDPDPSNRVVRHIVAPNLRGG